MTNNGDLNVVVGLDTTEVTKQIKELDDEITNLLIKLGKVSTTKKKGEILKKIDDIKKEIKEKKVTITKPKKPKPIVTKAAEQTKQQEAQVEIPAAVLSKEKKVTKKTRKTEKIVSKATEEIQQKEAQVEIRAANLSEEIKKLNSQVISNLVTLQNILGKLNKEILEAPNVEERRKLRLTKTTSRDDTGVKNRIVQATAVNLRREESKDISNQRFKITQEGITQRSAEANQTRITIKGMGVQGQADRQQAFLQAIQPFKQADTAIKQFVAQSRVETNQKRFELAKIAEGHNYYLKDKKIDSDHGIKERAIDRRFNLQEKHNNFQEQHALRQFAWNTQHKIDTEKQNRSDRQKKETDDRIIKVGAITQKAATEIKKCEIAAGVKRERVEVLNKGTENVTKWRNVFGNLREATLKLNLQIRKNKLASYVSPEEREERKKIEKKHRQNGKKIEKKHRQNGKNSKKNEKNSKKNGKNSKKNGKKIEKQNKQKGLNRDMKNK